MKAKIHIVYQEDSHVLHIGFHGFNPGTIVTDDAAPDMLQTTALFVKKDGMIYMLQHALSDMIDEEMRRLEQLKHA